MDDGIIVVENTMRILETEDLSPEEATRKSMHQITGAIIATTLVTVAIYVPIAFFGGMVGNIYMQFSVTMCVALAFPQQFPDAQPRAVRSAAEKEAKETEQVQPLPPLQRLSGMGAQKLYQMRRHHGAPRVAYADSAGRCPGRQLETV